MATKVVFECDKCGREFKPDTRPDDYYGMNDYVGKGYPSFDLMPLDINIGIPMEEGSKHIQVDLCDQCWDLIWQVLEKLGELLNIEVR